MRMIEITLITRFRTLNMKSMIVEGRNAQVRLNVDTVRIYLCLMPFCFVFAYCIFSLIMKQGTLELCSFLL